MRFITRTLTIAAAVTALSGAAFAAQTAPAAPTPTKAKAAAPAKAAKAAKATVISASGTVSKFDAASNMLTLTTAKGDVSFTVDSSASIMASGKKVASSDLSSEVGHKATVRYTEANGQKTATSIRVMAAPKAASAKKTATTKKS